jgi:hypothetical protein
VPGGFRGLGRTRRGPMPRRRLGGGEEMRVTPARLLQQCCQAARQRRTRADRSGTSAQRRDHNGRSWMMCSLLWSKGSSPCTQLRAPVPRSRAISVPLAGVSSGTSRLLTDDCLARSAPQHANTSLCKQVIVGGGRAAWPGSVVRPTLGALLGAGLSRLSHRLTGRHGTRADGLDMQWTLTCGYGFCSTGRTQTSHQAWAAEPGPHRPRSCQIRA